MWQDIEPDTAYLIGDTQVAFDEGVLVILRRIDPRGKHLKAIERGRVAPRGQNGLVPSEVQGYALKTKVLGQGGAVRVHGRYLADGTLHFDLITRH
jgi:hypothetical protein